MILIIIRVSFDKFECFLLGTSVVKCIWASLLVCLFFCVHVPKYGDCPKTTFQCILLLFVAPRRENVVSPGQ